MSLLVLAGCTRIDPLYCSQHPLDLENCPAQGNALDAGLIVDDSGVERRCFGEGAWTVCVLPSDIKTVVALSTTGTLSTDDPSVCMPFTAPWIRPTGAGDVAGEACLIAAISIATQDRTGTGANDAPVRITGRRPLILAAVDTVRISALLDVSGEVVGDPGGPRGTEPGPGALLQCDFPTMPQPRNDGGGGGAGGSFATRGGGGGTGKNGAATGGSPGPEVAPYIALRGGCPGQAGAPSEQASGHPGPGGGAIYVLASRKLEITSNGVIDASGAGGAGGSPDSGGSGGGSGGMILMFGGTDSVIDPLARVFANGGGGASGGADGMGDDGLDPTEPLAAASGGDGGYPSDQRRGAGGGAGYALNIPAQGGSSVGVATKGGGGGGGGGGGVVGSNLALGSNVSPAQLPLP